MSIIGTILWIILALAVVVVLISAIQIVKRRSGNRSFADYNDAVESHFGCSREKWYRTLNCKK